MTTFPSSLFIFLHASSYLFRIVERNAEEYSCRDGEDESWPSDEESDPTEVWMYLARSAATEAFVGVAAHLEGTSSCWFFIAEFVGSGSGSG
jgi:hypothetical protein